MIAGSHLVLATASGEVDASLGRWGLQGKGGLSVAAGEQVEVTGVHKTLKGRQVFVVRTVKADGQVYTMRNQHGIPYRLRHASVPARNRRRKATRYEPKNLCWTSRIHFSGVRFLTGCSSSSSSTPKVAITATSGGGKPRKSERHLQIRW